MKKSTLLSITLATVVALTVGSSSARAALHIKFDGIDGESNDFIHKDWCDAISFSHGFSKDKDSNPTRRRGGVIVDDLVFTKEMDKASPKIAEAVLKRTVFPKVEIHLTGTFGGARKTYLAYELKNVLITSYAISGSGNAEFGPPTEEISFSFEEIKVSYTKYDQGGNLEDIIEFRWVVEDDDDDDG